MIYPPTLKSTQSAFAIDSSLQGAYAIHFTLQSISSINEIGHIQIRLVRQSNNKSIVNTDKYPDGIIYKTPAQIGSNGKEYYVNILSTDLAEFWQAGYLYKVQMRFGVNPIFSSTADFATWKKQQIETNAFSEWSTVMVIKAISAPTVEIINSQLVSQDVIATERTEASLTPVFYGTVIQPASNNEPVSKYKFDLYKDDKELESSGWLSSNASAEEGDKHRFKTVLTNAETYSVVYSIITINGYEKSSQPYYFNVAVTYLNILEDTVLTAEDNTPYCKENGCINLYCESLNEFTGSYVITRASEKTDYSVWEDLAYLTFSRQSFITKGLLYQDFTIESGIKYKYALQQENKVGLRTSPLYENNKPYRMVNFEYSYLYRDGIQVRFQFNQTLSSFKHTVLRSKQDTLGDKYPHLVQNGNAKYAEFPVSGLISFHMDSDQTFFTAGPRGYYYKNELVIPSDKFHGQALKRSDNEIPIETNDNPWIIDTNLTEDNIFIERIFREKVEDFLNDFEYKLYKSPTEGNIVVGLMNVTLTPNSQLGRMIYSFSATAYEVLENTISNLDEVGILHIGEFTSLESDDTSLSFGQVSGIYGNNVDIYELIREQEEVSIGSGYRTDLKHIISIWVEQYPKLDFTATELELNALKSQTDDEALLAEYDKQFAEIQDLKSALAGPLATTAVFNINGAQVLLRPNKVYSAAESINSLSLVSCVQPLIINYICELTQKEDEEVKVVSAIDSSRIWGQVSGVFTGTDKILKAYDYNYHDSETFRIYNPNPDKTVIYDAQGKVLVDNTNYNVYQDVNILDIIKEEVRHQVELIYNTPLFYQNGAWESQDGTLNYEFAQIATFDIEADEGTIILIGKAADGSDAVKIRLGPSGRYVLNTLEEEGNIVRYIALEKPQFCVINYKCLTRQMKMSAGGSSNA